MKDNKKSNTQSQQPIDVSTGGVGFGHGNTEMNMPLPQPEYKRPKKGFVEGGE